MARKQLLVKSAAREKILHGSLALADAVHRRKAGLWPGDRRTK